MWGYCKFPSGSRVKPWWRSRWKASISSEDLAVKKLERGQKPINFTDEFGKLSKICFGQILKKLSEILYACLYELRLLFVLATEYTSLRIFLSILRQIFIFGRPA